MISNITTLKHGYDEFLNPLFVKLFSVLNNVGLAGSSRLVPRRLFNAIASQQKLLEAMVQMADTRSPDPLIPYYVLFVPAASFYLPQSDIAPDGPGAASVTPAWVSHFQSHSLCDTDLEVERLAVACFHGSFWDPIDPTASEAGSPSDAFRNAHTAIETLRKLAPESGAYQNETDPFEPDPVQAFWGQAKLWSSAEDRERDRSRQHHDL